MSIRIHHLNCGTMCPYGGRLMSGQGGVFEASEMCCHCLLIETDGGLVLVDTGIGTDDVANPARMGTAFRALTRPQFRLEETARAQIERLGFKAEDVRHIAVTHLDLDHAGGLPDFPKAKVHVFETELNAALAPGLRERMRYLQVQWAHGPDWVRHKVEGERWFGFEAIRAIPGLNTEVLLIPLTGHTRGHCGVAVKNGERWLIHCGDAYFHHGDLDSPPTSPVGIRLFQSAMQMNGPQRHHNQQRLRELAAAHRAEVDIFCAHDPSELTRQRSQVGG